MLLQVKMGWSSILGILGIRNTSNIYDNKRGLWIEVIPETVGQSTGLKDKKGVEGVQGDLLRHLDRNGLNPIEIVWKNGGWQGRYLGGVTTDSTDGFTFRLSQHEMSRAEIIGTIHDKE